MSRRSVELGIESTGDAPELLATIDRIDPAAGEPVADNAQDVRESLPALKPEAKRFHGAKVPSAWLSAPLVSPAGGDRFG